MTRIYQKLIFNLKQSTICGILLGKYMIHLICIHFCKLDFILRNGDTLPLFSKGYPYYYPNNATAEWTFNMETPTNLSSDSDLYFFINIDYLCIGSGDILLAYSEPDGRDIFSFSSYYCPGDIISGLSFASNEHNCDYRFFIKHK